MKRVVLKDSDLTSIIKSFRSRSNGTLEGIVEIDWANVRFFFRYITYPHICINYWARSLGVNLELIALSNRVWYERLEPQLYNILRDRRNKVEGIEEPKDVRSMFP